MKELNKDKTNSDSLNLKFLGLKRLRMSIFMTAVIQWDGMGKDRYQSYHIVGFTEIYFWILHTKPSYSDIYPYELRTTMRAIKTRCARRTLMTITKGDLHRLTTMCCHKDGIGVVLFV